MNAKDGWISGMDTQHWFLKITSDGGDHWSTITPNEFDSDYHKTYFYDKNNGWTTASYKDEKMGLWRTDDSGRNWKQLSYPNQKETIDQFNFINPKEGWIATSTEPAMNQSQKSIYHTIDGGKKWKQMFHSASDNILSYGVVTGITFISSLNGWLSMSNPNDNTVRLFQTLNGGKDWTMVHVTISKSISTNGFVTTYAPVFSHDKNKGVFLAEFTDEPIYVLYYTQNKGVSWSPINIPNTVEAIDVPSPMTGLIINKDKTIQITSNQSTTWTNINTDNVFKQTFSKTSEVSRVQYIPNKEIFLLIKDNRVGKEPQYYLLKMEDMKKWSIIQP